MERMIRLDNKFVVKIKNKYYLTNVSNVGEWRKMGDSEKAKRYLELYKSNSNINIKTKPSKKRLRTIKKNIVVKGGGWPFAINMIGQKGGWKSKMTGGWINKIKGGFRPWGAITSTTGQKGGWDHTKRN